MREVLAMVVPEQYGVVERFGRGDVELLRDHLAALTAFLEAQTYQTRRSYACAIRQFFEFHDWVCPADVTVQHASSFKRALIESGRSKATVSQRMYALRSYFEFLLRPFSASQDGLVRHNPIAQVGLRDVRPDPYEQARAMPWSKFERLLAATPRTDIMGIRDRAILLFFAFTGRRRREVARLRVRDLDLSARPRTYRCVVKGNKTLSFELPDICYESIRDYWQLADRLRHLGPDSGVFVELPGDDYGRGTRRSNGHGPEAPLGESSMRFVLLRAAERAGLLYDPDCTLHAIRHMYANDAEAAGASIRQIQAALGHRSIATTERYLQKLNGARAALEDRLRDYRKMGSPAEGVQLDQ